MLAHRRVQRVGLVVVHRGSHRGQLGPVEHLPDGQPGPPEFVGEFLVTGVNGLGPSLLRVPVLDLAGCPVGGHELQPVPAGSSPRLTGRHHLDGVAGDQLRLQGDEPATHLGPYAGMSDVGVDGVGEVDQRGPQRKGHHPALWREDVDLVEFQIGLQVGHEGAGVLRLGLPLHDPTQPGHLVARRVGLVVPVGGHPVLGPGVHLVGTYLELHLLALGADDGGVQRLVQVELGHGHVVLEAPLHRFPGGMDGAQRGIAVAHVLDHDTHPNQVVDLLEGPTLHDHLLVDAPQLLWSTVDLAGDAHLAEPALDLADDLCQVQVALRRPVLDHLVDLAVALGMQGGQRQVLQLVLDLLHAQPVGQRGVDVQSLLGHPFLLVFGQRGQGSHVVESVGQLDYQHPEVLGQGDQHLADAGRLLFLAGVEVEALQLGDAVHDEPDIGTEVPLEVVEGDGGVLHRIVQQGGGHRHVIQTLPGHDGGHRQRMVDVGLSGLAGLACMGGQRHLVGPLDHRRIRAGMMDPVFGQQGRRLVDHLTGAASPREYPGHRGHLSGTHF